MVYLSISFDNLGMDHAADRARVRHGIEGRRSMHGTGTTNTTGATDGSARRGRRPLRAALATLVAGGLLLTAGCAGRDAGGPAAGTDGASGSGAPVARIAIATPEKETDHGWNQQGLVGARAAGEALGIAVDEHENIGYDGTETLLTQIAEGDGSDEAPDLLIAHASGFTSAGHRVGLQTGVPTLVVDVESNEPGTVATVIPQPQQGAYLAGIAAAMQTETGTVGIVASAENLNWFLMAGGFVQGARSVDPDLDIAIAYVGTANFADSAGGAATMEQMIATGADVIMGMGDGATVGYLQAIETARTDHPISYVATIGDVSDIVDDPDTVLTSVMWNYADTYEQAIADIEDGTFGTRTYELTVANGGLSLQESDRLDQATLAAVDEATAGIADGSIDVTAAETRDAVQALIDGDA